MWRASLRTAGVPRFTNEKRSQVQLVLILLRGEQRVEETEGNGSGAEARGSSVEEAARSAAAEGSRWNTNMFLVPNKGFKAALHYRDCGGIIDTNS